MQTRTERIAIYFIDHNVIVENLKALVTGLVERTDRYVLILNSNINRVDLSRTERRSGLKPRVAEREGTGRNAFRVTLFCPTFHHGFR